MADRSMARHGRIAESTVMETIVHVRHVRAVG
jgi:hypothetical protein